MMPCHQHSLCISSLFSDSVLSPPPPIPHGFHGKAQHLIADGEIEDVAHNVGGFAHSLDAVDAHRPSVVVLIEVGFAHILLQISQDASECRRLIDCGINLYIQKEQLTLLDEEGHPSLFATIMIATLSTCAQLERDNISFRLQSGRKRYIEKGGKLGRKVGSVKTAEQMKTEYREVISLLRKGYSIRDMAKLCGKGVSTVQRVKRLLKVQSSQ